MTVTRDTRLRRSALVGLILLAFLTLSQQPASAHAALTSTTPLDGENVATAPAEVVLTFSEAVGLPASGIRVFDDRGERVDLGDARVGDRVDVARVGLPDDLGDGTYIVTWRAASEDGHPIRGAFLFSVGDAGAVDDDVVAGLLAGTDDVTATVLARANRVAAYAAALLVAGALLFWARADDRRSGRRFVRGAAIGAAVTAVLAVPLDAVVVSGLGLDALTNGAAMSDAVRGPIGRAAGVGLLGALLALVVLRDHGREAEQPDTAAGTNRAQPLHALAALLLLAAFTLEGHTLTTSPRWLVVTTDLAHLAAAAGWTGGLAILWWTLGRARHDHGADGADGAPRAVSAVDAFSLMTVYSFGAVVVTGSLLAWLEVRALRAFTTPYGSVLLIKIGLVAAVAAVGAYNHYRLVPALRAGDRTATWPRLRRTLRVEVVGIIFVLIATSLLVNLQPAREAAGIGGLYSTYQPFGAEGELNLVVDPNRAGVNEIHVYLLDATGRPTDDITDIRLELAMPAAQIGPLERVPETAGPGHWSTVGPELAIPGTWEVTVIATRDGSEELRSSVTVVVNP